MNMATSPTSVRNPQAAALFVSHLVLSNPELAEQQLAELLDGLIANPPEAGTLFAILEEIRTPLNFVEDERARTYHNKPLVLSDEQEECLQKVLAVWQRMSKAYGLCLHVKNPSGDDTEYATRIATILHRCLYYTGMLLLEYFRARREVTPGIWHDLHGYYETAEQWGVSHTAVSDPLESKLQATHCAAAYVTTLLIDMANPYGHSVRDLNLIRHWAGMWAHLVSLHPLEDENELPPYVVQLTSDRPIHPSSTNDNIGPETRRLDTSRLGLQISHMLAQLSQRLTPAQLGLGGETSGHVMKLLEQLSRPWTQTAAQRKFRRFDSQGTARVTVGFDAMHSFISGNDFVQPDSATTYSRSQFDQLYTYRERAITGQQLNINARRAFPIDDWAVINHSANGFRLARSEAGLKITYSELLAICPHDGDHFLLGQVSWLMQETGDGLVAGISLLPGIPEAIGVRHAPSAPGVENRYVRAFLLPAIPAIGLEASIVIPVETYKASGVLDVVDQGTTWQLRMLHVRQRGVDFDRVSFEKL